MQTPRRSRRLQGLEPETYFSMNTSEEKESQPIWSWVALSVAIASVPVFFALVN
jgi:hypothetical protein